MLTTQRRTRGGINFWPGFVDVLTNVLLVVVFVLLVFTVVQYYLTTELFGRNQALEELRGQVEELAQTLSLERQQRQRLEEEISEVYADLHATLAERDQLAQSLRLTTAEAEQLRAELAATEEEVTVARDKLKLKLREIASLQADIAALREVRKELEARVGELAASLESTQTELGQARDRTKALQAKLASAQERTHLAQETIEQQEIRIQDLTAEIQERDRALEKEQQLTASAQAKVDALRRAVQALQQQIAAVSEALQISEQTVASQKATIENLGERLNIALAQRVQELSRYRSEFFGRLREALGDIPELRIVGDRFMLQSELLFESGSAQIGPEGREKLAKVADVIQEIAGQIPGDIGWVLQVEGHTDKRPISTPKFPSNWELSTARALSIVHYLIDQGVAPRHLAATGYGKYQPVDPRDTPEAYARNRRIEFRLTNPPGDGAGTASDLAGAGQAG